MGKEFPKFGEIKKQMYHSSKRITAIGDVNIGNIIIASEFPCLKNQLSDNGKVTPLYIFLPKPIR